MEYVFGGCLVLLVLVSVAYLLQAQLFAYMIDKSVFRKRMEKPQNLKYFGPEDFVGLNAEEHNFSSNMGQLLYGVLYFYPAEEYCGLVVLAHGMGGGHRAYMCEIEHFAKRGYKVFSYDMTATQNSQGKELRGFEQGFIDLYYALEYIHQIDNSPILLYGHSLGGYSVINVLNYNLPYVKGIVSLSAFNDGNCLFIKQIERFLKKKTAKVVKLLEKKAYQRFKNNANIKSVDTLIKAEIPILLVHGKEDDVVEYKESMQFFYDTLVNKENITFVSVNGKLHRPNISQEATQYACEVDNTVARLSASKKGKEELQKYYQSLNYELLVEFDNDVMKVIDDFMDTTIKS